VISSQDEGDEGHTPASLSTAAVALTCGPVQRRCAALRCAGDCISRYVAADSFFCRTHALPPLLLAAGMRARVFCNFVMCVTRMNVCARARATSSSAPRWGGGGRAPPAHSLCPSTVSCVCVSARSQPATRHPPAPALLDSGLCLGGRQRVVARGACARGRVHSAAGASGQRAGFIAIKSDFRARRAAYILRRSARVRAPSWQLSRARARSSFRGRPLTSRSEPRGAPRLAF
jgi:hypothetical protein